LRLIKKDERQFPRVTPIEDDCTFISNNQSVNITRLYVEAGDDENGQPIAAQVRDRIVFGLAQQV